MVGGKEDVFVHSARKMNHSVILPDTSAGSGCSEISRMGITEEAFWRSQESNISINALILNNLYVLDK